MQLILGYLGRCLPILMSVNCSHNKSQQDALFLNLILLNNSTCFGQTYCPSSGVLILYSQQLVFVILVMLTNVINYVKAQRLSWFGHINRMPETTSSIVKKIHKWKPFTGRPVGRPKSRWEDDVRNDLKKMKLKKWTEQVQDHLRCKGIVEKAKTTRVVASSKKKLC